VSANDKKYAPVRPDCGPDENLVPILVGVEGDWWKQLVLSGKSPTQADTLIFEWRKRCGDGLAPAQIRAALEGV